MKTDINEILAGAKKHLATGRLDSYTQGFIAVLERNALDTLVDEQQRIEAAALAIQLRAVTGLEVT